MPVVKSETLYLKQLGAYPGNKWVKAYNFDSKRGVFTISMPAAFQELFPDHKVSGASLDDVDKALSEAMKKWDSVQTTTRKVILYRFAINMWEKNKTNQKAKKVRTDFKGSSFEKAPEFGLGFEYEVAMERVINKKAEYYRLKDEDSDEGEDFKWKVNILYPNKDNNRWDEPTSTQVVDWSEERETFFSNLQASLIRVINTVLAFEKTIADPKKLDQLILSAPKTFLLEGSKKSK